FANHPEHMGLRDIASYDIFFSSRRRHTSWPRDWSSDVCSSDLVDDHDRPIAELQRLYSLHNELFGVTPPEDWLDVDQALSAELRSEERRVGKGCRCRELPFE